MYVCIFIAEHTIRRLTVDRALFPMLEPQKIPAPRRCLICPRIGPVNVLYWMLLL